MDFETYREVLFERQLTKQGLINSLTLGAVGATFAMLAASVVVFFVQWPSSTAGSTYKRLIDGVTNLPAAVTNIVIAVGFLVAVAGPPFGLHGTVLLLLLAYLVLTMPQATISASSALTQVGGDLSEASLLSRASEAKTFGRIVLPLMVPGLAAGWAFVFVMIAGDITASAILAGTGNPVVGFVILDLFTSGTYPQLAALGVVLTLASSVVVLTVLKLSRRRWQSH